MPSTIPRTRAQLVDQIETAWSKLEAELDAAPEGIGDVVCVDDWTVRDMLAVRAWWTHSGVDWIEAGRKGANGVALELPAPGYRWSETPRLNASIVEQSAERSLAEVEADLRAGVDRVRAVIRSLDDRELCEVGAFGWTGKWPVCRWLSINTARQYVTARTYLRRAVAAKREAGEGQ